MNAVPLISLVLWGVAADLRDTPSMVSLVPTVPEQAIREQCTSPEWDEERRRVEEARQRYRLADLTRTVSEAEAAKADLDRASEASMAMGRAHDECVTKGIEATLPVLPLRAYPDEGAAKLGEIQMYLLAGGPLRYRYVNRSGVAVPFDPDSYDGDWGYSSIYHTALRRSGDWVQLPRRPFPEPVWIDLRDLGALAEVKPIQSFHVIDLRTVPFTGSALIVGIDASQVRIREEIPSDMPCGEEFSEEQIREAEQKARSVTMPLRELFDSDGHLLIAVKYSRGC
jgi:hypothetical protein